LPPGLSLSSSGTITGTPTTAGLYAFTVTATNGLAPDATEVVAIKVNARLTVTPRSGPSGTAVIVHGEGLCAG
jgi:hypothetical protein